MIAELDQTDTAADLEVPIIDAQEAVGTEEAPSKGKGSRWNAVQHGLMAKDLLPEPLMGEVKRWTAVLIDEFKPASPYENAQVTIMGRSGAQLERLRKLRIIDMQRGMDRAALCWDSDICVFTDKIAARLSKDPLRVSRALARSKQGAEWLLQSWLGLRVALVDNDGWDEAQCALARDLAGIRVELRNACKTISTETDCATLAALVEREVERLQGLLETSLLALDDGAQAMAMAGMPGEEDAESKKHRKYENSARREYELAKAELLASKARAAAGVADPVPAAATSPVATPYERDPDPEIDPELEPKREATPPTASEFQMMRSKLDTVLPETASACEKPMAEPTAVRVVEVAPDVEPVLVAGVEVDLPPTVRVASNASRAAATKPRGNRRLRRALDREARKAASRKGR